MQGLPETKSDPAAVRPDVTPPGNCGEVRLVAEKICMWAFVGLF